VKIYYFFIIWIVFYSCIGNKKNDSYKTKIDNENQVINSDFQSIIDSAKVEGSILIYDFQKNIYYSNNFIWANNGKLPASTFKIPNSIIALENGIVKNDNTLLKWDKKKRYLKIWEQDLTFREAFHLSCVPCYQELARKTGDKIMNQYLTKLKYGSMVVDSTNIDVFWLEGDSRISQFEQIDFLKQFYESKLLISKRTEKIVKEMIIMEKNENYNLSGKTGMSTSNGNNNGWFIGYIEVENKVYFFATNIESKKEFNLKIFLIIRKKVTFNALKQLDIIK